MSFPYFISPEQAMRERSELARKGISRGRSVVALAYSGGVLFVAENPSRSLQKVSELYDRFTAAQFAQLTYTAGSSGSQSMVIAAQTGDLQPNGTITQVVDSPAVQITASVVDATGTGSGWNLTVEGQSGTGKSPVFAQYCPNTKCGSDPEADYGYQGQA